MLQNSVWFCTSSKKQKKNPQKATLLIGSPTSSSFGSCSAMLSSKATVGFLAVSRMSCTSRSPRSSRPLARIPTLITPFSIRAELSVLPRKIRMKTSRAEITAQRTRWGGGGLLCVYTVGKNQKWRHCQNFCCCLCNVIQVILPSCTNYQKRQQMVKYLRNKLPEKADSCLT